MIRNLGRVATVLARQHAAEIDMHMDVDAWHAPSECHALVAKNEARRERQARRHAEALAQRPMRVIRKELNERGCPMGGPQWDALISRLIRFPQYVGGAA